MPRCCGSAGTCSCKYEAGRNIDLDGDGSIQRPLVISADIALDTESNQTFNIALTGTGRLESPWMLTVTYADTASIDDLPDVDTSGAVNGNVLAFNTATQKWQAAPPTTAAAGGMSTDTSIHGDGSVGDVLGVDANPLRYLIVDPAGVGISNAGINRMLRLFPDAPTRDSASPAPETGTLSMLLDDPGVLDYFDGTSWEPLTNGISLDVKPGEMLDLSGAYAGGPVVQYVAQLDVATDATGAFEVIPTVDLATYAGVLAVTVTPIGTIPWHAILDTDTDRIVGIAYRIDDGTPYASVALTGTVTALLY